LFNYSYSATSKTDYSYSADLRHHNQYLLIQNPNTRRSGSAGSSLTANKAASECAMRA